MIFFDMDGVLCDFNKAAKGLISKAGLELPAADDWHYLSDPKYKKQVQFIAESYDFWKDLEPLAPAVRAFNMCGEYAMILSSPQFSVSASPKIDWCAKHLGIKDDKIILTSAKEFLAGGMRWLVDDKSTNCQKFAEHGGRAILVEQPYSYKDADITRDTLHPKVLPTSIDNLPSLISGILEMVYGV